MKSQFEKRMVAPGSPSPHEQPSQTRRQCLRDDEGDDRSCFRFVQIITSGTCTKEKVSVRKGHGSVASQPLAMLVVPLPQHFATALFASYISTALATHANDCHRGLFSQLPAKHLTRGELLLSTAG